MRDILREYDPKFCAVSLDEAYLDLTKHVEKRKNMSEEERTFYQASHKSSSNNSRFPMKKWLVSPVASVRLSLESARCTMFQVRTPATQRPDESPEDVDDTAASSRAGDASFALLDTDTELTGMLDNTATTQISDEETGDENMRTKSTEDISKDRSETAESFSVDSEVLQTTMDDSAEVDSIDVTTEAMPTDEDSQARMSLEQKSEDPDGGGKEREPETDEPAAKDLDVVDETQSQKERQRVAVTFGVSAVETVREIRFRIEQKTGLTASAGKCRCALRCVPVPFVCSEPVGIVKVMSSDRNRTEHDAGESVFGYEQTERSVLHPAQQSCCCQLHQHAAHQEGQFNSVLHCVGFSCILLILRFISKLLGTLQQCVHHCHNLQISGIGKVQEKMLAAVGVQVCADLHKKRGLLYHLYSTVTFNHFMRISLAIGSIAMGK